MITSMTGFAVASQELSPWRITVELKTVNHRFFEFMLRAPEELRPLEIALRDAAAKRIVRGKVDCRIQLQSSQSGAQAALDSQKLHEVFALQDALSLQHPGLVPMTTAELLAWPGVMVRADIAPEVLAAAVHHLFQQVLADLVATRAREGQHMAEFMGARTASLRELAGRAGPLAQQSVLDYQTRLAEKIAEANAAIAATAAAGGAAGASIADERLQQEIVMFAAKVDVAEELSRLGAHADEVDRVVKAAPKEGAGKRLDFLMQELNREANTLGSKSASTELTRIAVDLKVAIEQMREQVQNIE